ncbi:MAG: alpha/beta hydrolase [Phycisphaeraceae bacterium]|nr:alpha/beta hydrolase [Phycisphaeraceae bacterium]
MSGLVLLMAIGLAVYAACLLASTLLTLQYPRRRTYAWAVSRRLPGDPGELTPALDFRRFEFESRGAQIIAWDITGLDPDGPLLILTHGWSDSKVGALSRIGALAPMASRLIAWDMPGHGESNGACELGLREHEDLLRLLEVVDADAGRAIVLMGWSLGAGVSVAAAAKRGVAGVIAEAPYRLAITPASNVMQARRSPWRLNLPAALWLVGLRATSRIRPWRGFDRAELAKALRCPVLVLHGSDDAVCPEAEAQAIANSAPDATLVEVAGARHNDLWTQSTTRAQATQAVRTFMARVSHAAVVGRSS